ncbi:MAG: hypothetical protein JW860_13835 [Sedimentisphaerales bacterium]|nr:hypothetical protein [Sedimentisphaerales bacterium]
MAEKKKNKQNGSGGRTQKSFRRKFAWVLLIGLFIGIVIKYFLVPYIVERMIQDYLEQRWVGPVEMGRLEINLFSSSRLRNLRCQDEQGRPWIQIDLIEVERGELFGPGPMVKRVELSGAMVTAHIEDGSCQWPVRASGAGSGGTLNPESFPEIALRHVAFEIKDERGIRWVRDDMNIQSRWADGESAPRIQVEWFSRENNDWLSLQGNLHPQSLESDLKFALNHVIERQDMAAMFAALDIPVVTDAAGSVTANLSVRGRLNDAGSLEINGQVNINDIVCRAGADEVNSDADVSIRFSGREAEILYANLITDVFTISFSKVPLAYEDEGNKVVARVSDARVRFPQKDEYGPFWESTLRGARFEGWLNFNGMIVLPTRRGGSLLEVFQGQGELARMVIPTKGSLEVTDLRIPEFKVRNTDVTIAELTCQTCGGQARGRGDISLYPFTYEFMLHVESLDSGQVIRTFNPLTEIKKGKTSGRFAISGFGFGLSGFHANAMLIMENVDLEAGPVFGGVLRTLSIKPESVQGTSDLMTRFHVDYPVMTIDKGLVANRLSALEFEPGSTLNLQTGDIQFRVVTGRLSEIRFALLTPIQNLAKKLVRLKITGNLSDKNNIVIHKEAVTDLKEGTIGFFTDWVQVGGDFGQQIKDLFNLLSGQLEPPKKDGVDSP